MQAIPQDIEEYLHLNKSHNQAAAICKILRSHTEIDVTSLFQGKLTYLPLLIAWFENSKRHLDKVNESIEVFKSRQLTAVYKFIRGMPQLAVDGYCSKKMKVQLELKSKKRKLDQTNTMGETSRHR